MADNLTLSPAAEQRIKHLIANHKNKNIFLRIYVEPGGCSGFQYHFDFDQKLDQAKDHSISKDEVVLAAIDNDSLEFLKGGEIDFVDELGGSFFKITIPQASSTCGCGSSFSV